MNRLASSSSLYLRQHADNPVDWQPWDEQALERARELDRPILLSIGYSACHWCHVMAHECFEDASIAAVMNELYVNVKVDREERPDLDRVYQLSHQLLTGRGGGWPLTVFIDPADLAPFFAGTYFPPAPRHGLPAFEDILRKVRQWFDDHRDQVREQNRQLAEAIATLQKNQPGEAPVGREAFEAAFEHLRQRYDDRHGGFGGAPKFPQAPLLALVQSLSRPDQPEPDVAGGMLRDTLSSMARSGLRDHLDGGFFRYTVDATWTIPHFEKMLYDNAMLLPLYAEAAKRWKDPVLREAAEGIATWLATEMAASDGGFHASIDADADGVEGGFHVWQREEVLELLGAEEYATVAPALGLDGPPNFEDHAWHLVRRDDPGGTPLPAAALDKLHRARSARTPPGVDTKRLTAWNALCVEGLARAGRALERPDWLDLAGDTLRFLREHLWIDSRLFSVYTGGKARFPAYLDDHAYLLQAILVLLRERWDPIWLDFAVELADTLLDRFEDPESGGFYFTADSEPAPIHRMRPLQDDATPSGNAVAASALLALGHLVGETRYLDAARRTLAAADNEPLNHPLAYAGLLVALDDFHHCPAQVVVYGPDRQRVEALADAARGLAAAQLRVHCYAPGDPAGRLPGLSADGPETLALVCRGLKCLPPVSSVEALRDLLCKQD